MIIHVDYIPYAKCNNSDTWGMICVKCGQCGRVFNERGICTNIDEYPAENEYQAEDESEVQDDDD